MDRLVKINHSTMCGKRDRDKKPSNKRQRGVARIDKSNDLSPRPLRNGAISLDSNEKSTCPPGRYVRGATFRERDRERKKNVETIAPNESPLFFSDRRARRFRTYGYVRQFRNVYRGRTSNY